MKLVVVDIDDTLLMGGRLSRFFWRLSLTFQRIGRRLQKVNSPLLGQLGEYETVVILSGRDRGETRFTQNQLRKAGVRYDKLICCPRKDLIKNWKMSIVSALDKDHRIVWIDDIFQDIPGNSTLRARHPNVTTVPPEAMPTNQSDRSSELEWL